MTPIVPAPASVPPPSAASPDATLRRALRRFSTGLIAYGIIGLAFAAIGLVLLLYVGNRVGGLAERTSTQVETVIATLDKASAALTDAGDTAVSFAVTLERIPPAVNQSAETVGNLQGNLRAVEQQLGAISILGANPLGGVSGIFGQMASDLEGLDARLAAIATSLDDNKMSLLANAESLRALGTQLAAVADDLRTGIVEESLADVQLILTVLFVLLVAWTAVPAAGALWIGWWLRRELPPAAPPN